MRDICYICSVYGRIREIRSEGAGGSAAALARRLSVRGPPRDGYLRGQGQEPAQARFVLFRAVEGAQREGAGAGPPDRRRPSHRRRERDGCPAARKLPDKEPPAALQHPAQGRQDLSVDRRAARGVSPRAVHAHAAARRLAVLRSLRVGDDAAQRAGLHPRGGPAAHVQTQSFARTDRPGTLFGLPAIPSGQLQGTLRRFAERGGVRPAGGAGRLGAPR